MIFVTFHNVTITVPAETPEDAYTLLCNALGSIMARRIHADWHTDTFSVGDETEQRPTDELFPKEGP